MSASKKSCIVNQNAKMTAALLSEGKSAKKSILKSKKEREKKGWEKDALKS